MKRNKYIFFGVMTIISGIIIGLVASISSTIVQYLLFFVGFTLMLLINQLKVTKY